jgi:hypothetical protein
VDIEADREHYSFVHHPRARPCHTRRWLAYQDTQGIGLVLIASAMYFEAFIAPSVAARTPDVFTDFPAGGGWEGFLVGVLVSGALFGLGFLLFGIRSVVAHDRSAAARTIFERCVLRRSVAAPRA